MVSQRVTLRDAAASAGLGVALRSHFLRSPPMVTVSSGANAVSLSIKTGAQGDRTFVIALRGEVDYTSARSSAKRFPRCWPAATRVLVIDLKEVSFLDSTGVGTLV